MKIIKSKILNSYDNLTFGFSTKIGLDRVAPYYFNLSYSVGDDKENVAENRDAFFRRLGLDESKIAFQKQIHSAIVKIVENAGKKGECDAMITAKKGIGLAVTSADCAAVFIYDKRNEVIAGIHSGWRGTEKRIVNKTLNLFADSFNSEPENLLVYVSPAISQENYEVGSEVAGLFDPKYIKTHDGSFYLDVTAANYDMLIEFGIPENQIEVSDLCSYENEKILHSYRRDGAESGRALGVIAMPDVK